MAYQFQSLKVLVVDDNRPMIELAKAILNTFGVGTVYTAMNGDDGFKIFCESNPDLVLVDWMMSPGDGIEMSRRIRNDPTSPNQYVPIILMTGFSEKKRVIHARDSGITEFLVKPFSARTLYKRIAQIVEKPRQFIRAEGFFGPDRRRKTADTYNGPLRRKSDRAGGRDAVGSYMVDVKDG